MPRKAPTMNALYAGLGLLMLLLGWGMVLGGSRFLRGLADRIEAWLNAREAREREARIARNRTLAIAEFDARDADRRRIAAEVLSEQDETDYTEWPRWAEDHGTNPREEAA